MTVKLIALDLDGTTLNNDKVISKENRAALAEAAAHGINIVVATGRPYMALPKDVFEIPAIRYVLTSNGASITDLHTGETFYENCLSVRAVEASVALLKNYHYVLEGFVKGTAYIQRDYYEMVQQTRKCFRDVDYVLQTRNPVDDIKEFILANKEHIENINVNFEPEDIDQKPAMRKQLLTIPEATITSSFKNNLEIGGATTSKAQALKEMSRLLDVKPGEMMAVGDSPNDIAMLNLAGFSVAVGNGEDEVKAAAKYIVADNHHDGVAEAVRKIALVGKM